MHLVLLYNMVKVNRALMDVIRLLRNVGVNMRVNLQTLRQKQRRSQYQRANYFQLFHIG